MKEESRYAKLEMAAIARNDHADAERCNKMRWRMMDKAIQFLEEGREKPYTVGKTNGSGEKP